MFEDGLFVVISNWNERVFLEVIIIFFFNWLADIHFVKWSDILYENFKLALFPNLLYYFLF